MFLFPVTIPAEPDYRASKYTSKIIYISRKVEYIVPYMINWDRVRDVERTHPGVVVMSDEYFQILHENLPAFEFFCRTVDMIVSLDYCFSTCRFKYKRCCDTYIRGTVCCKACNRRYSCEDIDNCESRRLTLMYMSLYFSELMKKTNIVRKMRHGLGYKKNYHGEGAQIYFNVGRLYLSVFHRHNNNPAIRHNRKMFFKRKLEHNRYLNKIKKQQELALHGRTKDKRVS